jgi:ArsR family transcriptional regulator
MLPHERSEYRQEMGHIWLGFSERQIGKLLAAAGFGPARFHALAPDPAAKGPALFMAAAAWAGSGGGGAERAPVTRN